MTQRLATADLTRGAHSIWFEGRTISGHAPLVFREIGTSIAVGVGMMVKNEFRIEPIGAEFRVIDPEGVKVGSFSTEDDARHAAL